MPPKAVFFDFDGVILQSVDIKTRAFAALFAAEGPEATGRIVAHHEANGGIYRFEKFRHAYREVLRRPLPPEQEKALGERFNDLVEAAVSACPWVPGAEAFLKAHHESLPLFVASGTPQTELRRIVERRGMSRYFKGTYGSPDAKDAILRRVAASLGCAGARLLMVGDAAGDLLAARAVGASFIGIAPPGRPSPFEEGTPLLPDLTGLSAALDSL